MSSTHENVTSKLKASAEHVSAARAGEAGALACGSILQLHIGYLNFQDGGHIGTDVLPDGSKRYNYDYQGLVDIVGQDEAWPDILVMGEGNFYGLNDEAGAKGAAEALHQASRRPYIPLVGCLPREWGPYAPVVFVDTQVIDIKRWYHPADPEFAARDRNRLVASLRGSSETFNIVATHGDTFDGDMRLADAKPFKRYAGSDEPCLIAGDWYCVPSGPMWEPLDINDPTAYRHPARSGRIIWQHGPEQGGPFVADTRSLDFLLGYWQPRNPDSNAIAADGTVLDWGQRVGGAGFYDLAELARDTTPTQYRPPESKQRAQLLAYDRMLVNKHWKDRVSDFRIRPPLDPHPSDHLMIDAVVRP